MPFAPARFSTITCCLRFSPRRGATMRHSTSLPPPGRKGETMQTGRGGWFCASAVAQETARSTEGTAVLRVTKDRKDAKRAALRAAKDAKDAKGNKIRTREREDNAKWVVEYVCGLSTY